MPGVAPRALLDEPTRFPEARRAPAVTLGLAARLYGNWDPGNATEHLRRLAALSVGAARAEFRQAAAQSTIDHQQGSTHSSATVEGTIVRGHGERRRGFVLTRERVRAPGLPGEGSRYRVTLATLEYRPDGWVIARWAPQP